MAMMPKQIGFEQADQFFGALVTKETTNHPSYFTLEAVGVFGAVGVSVGIEFVHMSKHQDDFKRNTSNILL